jgi:hypothetical protein
MSYYLKVNAETKEAVIEKAKAEILKIDFMRSPSLHTIQQNEDGTFTAVIKYFGLD